MHLSKEKPLWVITKLMKSITRVGGRMGRMAGKRIIRNSIHVTTRSHVTWSHLGGSLRLYKRTAMTEFEKKWERFTGSGLAVCFFWYPPPQPVLLFRAEPSCTVPDGHPNAADSNLEVTRLSHELWVRELTLLQYNLNWQSRDRTDENSERVRWIIELTCLLLTAPFPCPPGAGEELNQWSPSF